MKESIILLSIVFLISCSTGLQTYEPQSGSSPQNSLSDLPPSEPGKCYAKVKMPNTKQTQSDTLGAFAMNEDIPPHLLHKITVSPSSSKWVKKKADRNCLSSNPEDCMVWCLENTPAVYAFPSVIIDTTQIEAMKYVVLSDNKNGEEISESIDWAEVICEGQITKEFVTNLYYALAAEGYNLGDFPSGRTVSIGIKQALKQYQIDNSLQQGQLTTESVSYTHLTLPTICSV